MNDGQENVESNTLILVRQGGLSSSLCSQMQDGHASKRTMFEC